MGTRDVAGRAAPEQCKRVLGLLAKDLEYLLHTSGAAERETVQRRPPDENRARALFNEGIQVDNGFPSAAAAARTVGQFSAWDDEMAVVLPSLPSSAS